MVREKLFKFLEEANQEELLAIRSLRMIGGAIYGFLAGMAYGLTVGTINALTFPDLPIVVEWGLAITTGIILGIVLALVGALTGWFTERLVGIGIGAVAIAIVGLGVQLFVVGVGSIGIIMLVVLSMPISVISLPVSIFLRWLSDRHLFTLIQVRSPWKQAGWFILLVIGAFALGIFPGSFQRMGVREDRSARLVQKALQLAPTDPQQAKKLPLETMPGLKEHLGQPYTLKVTKSKISTVGYDVHVLFEDGYVMTCVTVAYTLTPYLSSCVLGAEITLPR
jgi:hypothetical protein